MDNLLIIPQEWHPVDDYSSHRPMLYLAAINTKNAVVELGSGNGSTRLLRDLLFKPVEKDHRTFLSFESNKDWAAKTGSHFIDAPYLALNIGADPTGLMFIDSSPGEERKYLIGKGAYLVDVIVIHDTEQGAEYVYRMAEILSTFKHRLDLHIPGMPSTTCVSNFIDVSKWKGEYSGFTFV